MSVIDAKKIIQIQNALMVWGKGHGKTYPWRYISDPYRILVSEFMLHRTQTDQVVPIYLSVINECPDLEAFYKKDSELLRVLLKPLGLNWRITNMIEALKTLSKDYEGIPLDPVKLMSVQGIGPYIARATVCFSLNTPEILIDANIVRVTGRVLGINLSGEPRRRKEIREGIETLLLKADPREYYYSMIDLAHQICKTQSPDCTQCPLHLVYCVYYIDQLDRKK